VLQATAGANASYTWRSIVKRIEVLQRGVVWRMGNGTSINIWTDPWLPRDLSSKTSYTKGAYYYVEG